MKYVALKAYLLKRSTGQTVKKVRDIVKFLRSHTANILITNLKIDQLGYSLLKSSNSVYPD